jgi:hypothetical protein
VSAALVNQKNKGKQEMTPNEIATDVASLNPMGTEIHGLSTNYTYCTGWNGQQRLDDSNTWD